MSSHSSTLPVFLGSLDLIVIFHFSSLRNGKLELLLPFLVCLLSTFFFWRLIFFILLPYKIFLCLVPHFLLNVPLYWVFITDQCIDLACLNSRQIIKLSSLAWILFCTDVLSRISEIFLCWFFLFFVDFDVDTLNEIDRDSLTVFLVSVSLELLDFFLI